MFLLSISDNEVTDVTSVSEGVTRKTVKKIFTPQEKYTWLFPPSPNKANLKDLLGITDIMTRI